jgi:hypothetical protein
MKPSLFALLFAFALGAAATRAGAESIARRWDEEILNAIRIDLPHPPVHARNLFHLSAVMYDAWAAYDTNAAGFLYHAKHPAANVGAARTEAISYAAYRLLRQRYALSRGAVTTLAVLDARFAALGYDRNQLGVDPATPAGVGNAVFAALSAYVAEDGARQNFAYTDLLPAEGGYQPANLPLGIAIPGTLATDVNRWQPLAVTDATTQNGIPTDSIQRFLGPQWLNVRPFALTRDEANRPWIDPGPPPRLGTATDAEFRANVVAALRYASELTPDDGVTQDFSPGKFGNNSLGANDGAGRPVNPFTGQPYAPNVLKRGDFSRVLAEFWADGPTSETPPGHWNTLANYVTDSGQLERRIAGVGPVVDELEWDVKLYFALNAAEHDAACAAWSLKRHYDGWRPITAIRYLGQLGQSSDPSAPRFHTNGLPLVPGLVELATAETSANGGRHAGYPLGSLLVLSWPGQPRLPAAQYSGARWIRPENWLPFQKRTFVTPAFPGYVSGHSTFSRAAAEVLTAFTGSPFFPGGLGTFTASKNNYLTFELGPSENVQLQWATYFDAADQSGISRIWGGIHPPADDFAGRRVGAEVGQRAWALARRYFDGSVSRQGAPMTLERLADGGILTRCETVRGQSYRLQSTPDLGTEFTDEPGGRFQAVDSPTLQTYPAAAPARFFRLLAEP